MTTSLNDRFKAFLGVKSFDTAHYRAILEALIAGPATCYEIAERTWGHEGARLDHVQCARRLPELYEAGKVVKAGEMKTAGPIVDFACNSRGIVFASVIPLSGDKDDILCEYDRTGQVIAKIPSPLNIPFSRRSTLAWILFL